MHNLLQTLDPLDDHSAPLDGRSADIVHVVIHVVNNVHLVQKPARLIREITIRGLLDRLLQGGHVARVVHPFADPLPRNRAD